MDGIGDDNAIFLKGNSVRRVLVALETKCLQLEDALANAKAVEKLIDVWVQTNGRPIPWDKAVTIIAVVGKLSDEEREKLLALGN